jgi:type IV pilus assembly protein PilA
MIVIAIIAILAAFAIPAYQDYTKRTYIAEGLTLAAPAKLAIAETFAVQGTIPKAKPNGQSFNTVFGLPDPKEITGQAVASVEIFNPAAIVITYNEKLGQAKVPATAIQGPVQLALITEGIEDPQAGGNEYAIKDVGSLVWHCGYAKGSSALLTNAPKQYLPAICRGS